MISALGCVPRGACAAKPIRPDIGEAIQGDEDDDAPPGLMDIREVELMEGGDSDSEAEDDELRASDAIFLSGRTEEDFAMLEVQVYDGEAGTLYVHHDITLPAFPLAFQWCRLGTGGPADSFVAVGTMEPVVEIWDLDVMDPMEPVLSLGGKPGSSSSSSSAAAAAAGDGKGKKKKKKKDKKQGGGGAKVGAGAHGDAVLSLSWRDHSPTVLASGSADKTVKLWDLHAGACALTWTHHGDKVAVVAWHRTELACLLTGSDDGSLAVRDARSETAGAAFVVGAKVEDAAWDPASPFTVAAAGEDGTVVAYDIRTNAQPLWTLAAHGGAGVPAVAFSEAYRGLFATAGVDGNVKLWDATKASAPPEPIATKALGVGQIYALAFDSQEGALIAAGGQGGTLALWDAKEDDAALAAWWVDADRTL